MGIINVNIASQIIGNPLDVRENAKVPLNSILTTSSLVINSKKLTI